MDVTAQGFLASAWVAVHKGANYRGLRQYDRWLIERFGNPDLLTKFETSVEWLDTSLKDQVLAGTLSESQAERQKGYHAWRNAILETGKAHAHERKQFRTLSAALEGKPTAHPQALQELRDRIDSEMVERLTDCLGLA